MSPLRSEEEIEVPLSLRDTREYIDMALAFANQSFVDVRDAQQLMLDRFGIRYVIEGPEPVVELPDGSSVKASHWLNEKRLWARIVLGRIVDKKPLRPIDEKKIDSYVREISVKLGFSSGQLTLKPPSIPFDITIGVGFGIALLVKTGLSASLRRCDECNRLFIGRHNSKYCNKCKGDVYARKNTDRQLRHRKKLKQENATKRRK